MIEARDKSRYLPPKLEGDIGRTSEADAERKLGGGVVFLSDGEVRLYGGVKPFERRSYPSTDTPTDQALERFTDEVDGDGLVHYPG